MKSTYVLIIFCLKNKGFSLDIYNCQSYISLCLNNTAIFSSISVLKMRYTFRYSTGSTQGDRAQKIFDIYLLQTNTKLSFAKMMMLSRSVAPIFSTVIGAPTQFLNFRRLQQSASSAHRNAFASHVI